MRRRVLPVVLLLAPIPGTAAGAAVEEVVVTAGADLGGYYEMPAITLRKKADFVVQQIRLVNDSRSPELRREEIIASISSLLRASRRERGMELSYGEGFLLPVDLSDDSLELINDRNRVDTSYVDVYVKSAIDETLTVKEQITGLRSFIALAELEGRTEILPLGDVGISIVNPEQYRYDILRRISEENERIRETVGTDCEITVGGLEGRVTWERTSVDELTLYIPYGTEITCR